MLFVYIAAHSVQKVTKSRYQTPFHFVSVVLGFRAVWFRRSMPTFRRNIFSPEEPKRWQLPTKPYGAKTQDNTNIVLTAVRSFSAVY
jgi:hypothetical protein